jgi:hypothetical protein
MRGQKAEVMGVAEGGEQGRRGSEKAAVVSMRGADKGTRDAYRGVSCWSVYVCSERSSVDKRRSTGMLESRSP